MNIYKCYVSEFLWIFSFSRKCNSISIFFCFFLGDENGKGKTVNEGGSSQPMTIHENRVDVATDTHVELPSVGIGKFFTIMFIHVLC